MVRFGPLSDFFGIPLERSASNVEAYIQRMLNVFELVSERAIRPLVSDHTINALIDEQCYLFIYSIRKLLAESNITSYSAEDVNRVLSGILTAASPLESSLQIVDVLYENESIDPDLVTLPGLSQISERVYTDGKRVLVWLALSSVSGEDDIPIAGLACPYTQQVVLRATVELVDSSVTLPELPLILEVQLSTVGRTDRLLEYIDAVKMFGRATDAKGIEAALRIAALKELRLSIPESSFQDIPFFRVRDELLRTADKYAFRHGDGATSRLMRSLVDVILDRNARQGHALREGYSGASPVRRRGRDLGRASA